MLCLVQFNQTIQAQPQSTISIHSGSGFEKEIASLMNDLNLTGEQKLVIGIVMLKHASSFDYSSFENASKTKQYKLAKKAINSLDKDLKEILDKSQFKVYKKHKKQLRKELIRS